MQKRVSRNQIGQRVHSVNNNIVISLIFFICKDLITNKENMTINYKKIFLFLLLKIGQGKVCPFFKSDPISFVEK